MKCFQECRHKRQWHELSRKRWTNDWSIDWL